MLGIIDWDRNPIEPRLFLAKPNREIIAELSEAYNIRFNSKIIELNDLEFDIPYVIDINHRLVRNRNIDLLKERYLIYMELGNYKEWFIIVKIKDNMDEEGDSRNVFAYSLAYQLKNKLIRGYQVDAKDIRYVLTDVLAETPWGIGTVDADFEVTYRSFEFSNTSVLDAIYQIGETYNAIIEWDTINRLISFIKPEFHGINRGLEFSYGHYLKTMGKESNADEMVTRLKAFGKDGMSINSVNPIGQNFIQDFSYFMYPFERDENRQVIQHSYYMSDSLCHALLDYDALVESKKEEFNTLLKNKENLQSTLSEKEIELNALKNQEAQINEIVLAQQFDENMWFHKFVYNGSPVYINQNTKRPEYSYVVLCKVSNTSNITVSLNGTPRSITSGSWVALGKVRNSNTISINITGSATNTEVFIQIANITTEEHDTPNNNSQLIEKYCLDHKQMQIEQKQSEIDTLKNQIKSVDNDIEVLRNLLAMENNFTEEQLYELSNYIIEREFEDQNYIDPHDLYEAALEKFEELKKPQMIIDIDVVYFKEVIEEQGNWDKLNLGDYVTVAYERMNTKVTAKVIEISYDFEERNIKLRIANIKDISDEDRKLEKYIYRSIGTSTTVSLEKSKWGKAVTDASEISRLFDNLWDKITNQINMASNEYVVYDRNGLTIFDPNDPLRFLRATHGALALTRSGGLRYETAITPDGIIAERLLGKILLTQRVTIGDDDGILEIRGPQAIITDRCNREVMKFGLVEENPDKFGIMLNRYASDNCNDTNIINRVFMTEDDGFKIQRKSGTSYEDIVWLDVDTGYLNAIGAHLRDSFITDGAIVGATLKIGSGNSVFKADLNGIYLGNEAFSLAPFRVDLNGNAYMRSAHIVDSFITEGAIVGATLKIGSGNSVFKADYNGIYLGNEDFNLAPFSVDLNGNLKASKALLTGPSGKVLIDTETGKIYLDNFDIIGAGTISAQYIMVNTVTAGEGFIADLTVNKLKTIGKEDRVGEIANFIDIKDNFAKWITGEIRSRTQATTNDGEPLYWTDSTKTYVTTEVTPYPMYKLDVYEREKLIIGLDGTDASAYPYIRMGEGSGTGFRGRAYIYKYNDSWEFTYYARATEYKRELLFEDSQLKLVSENGGIILEHSTGSIISISDDGNVIDIQLRNGSLISLNTSGLTMNITGGVTINATGQIRLNGSSIHLN